MYFNYLYFYNAYISCITYKYFLPYIVVFENKSYEEKYVKALSLLIGLLRCFLTKIFCITLKKLIKLFLFIN